MLTALRMTSSDCVWGELFLLECQPLIWLSDFKERFRTCFLKACQEANLISIYKNELLDGFALCTLLMLYLCGLLGCSCVVTTYGF